MVRRRRQQQRDPYTKDPRDPLELVGRMLVGTSYRQPVEGTGTRSGLQASEVAAALGFLRDPLTREVAVAVATRAERPQVAMMANRAYRRCARAIRLMRPPRALNLSVAADRWRLRMLIFDVATELVHSERRKMPKGKLAIDTKMRKADYCRAHRVVMAELQACLNEARTEFRTRLWGD